MKGYFLLAFDLIVAIIRIWNSNDFALVIKFNLIIKISTWNRKQK